MRRNGRCQHDYLRKEKGQERMRLERADNGRESQETVRERKGLEWKQIKQTIGIT